MTEKLWPVFGLLIVIMTFVACADLRFSKVTPEVKNFHPQKLGIVLVDIGSYEEAKGKIDQIIPQILLDKHWFKSVVTVAAYKQLQLDGEFSRSAAEYFAKLKTVNYSDPELSKKIGKEWNVEGLLVVTVEYWNYTQEKGKKIAKVSLGMKMIETETGNIVWQAAHHVAKSYTFFAPSLSDVARDTVKRMLREMPH
jgi:hypothetical protein